jgi:hypothetical protein
MPCTSEGPWKLVLNFTGTPAKCERNTPCRPLQRTTWKLLVLYPFETWLLATSSNYSYKRNTLFTTKYIIQRQANVRLACQPPANSNFLSEQISIRHQPPASQRYFSLRINQHRPPTISQQNRLLSAFLLAAA